MKSGTTSSITPFQTWSLAPEISIARTSSKPITAASPSMKSLDQHLPPLQRRLPRKRPWAPALRLFIEGVSIQYALCCLSTRPSVTRLLLQRLSGTPAPILQRQRIQGSALAKEQIRCQFLDQRPALRG